MKFKSEVITQASGSIGGVTYARNRGGLYRRSRTIPVNPNSSAQQIVRGILGALSTAWREDLTITQRTDWSNYAANTPVKNVFGDSFLLSGQQMYIRNNSIRLRAEFPRVDDGPGLPGGIDLSPITIDAVDGTDIISITFDDTDSWANEDGGGLSIQLSRQVAASINFFRSPFRWASTIPGATASPPSSPEASNNPFGTSYVAGNKVFGRITAFGADGRISNIQTDVDVIDV